MGGLNGRTLGHKRLYCAQYASNADIGKLLVVPSKQQHVVAVAICLPSSCARPLEPRRVGETLPGKSTVACIFSLIPGKVSPDLPVRCVYVYTRESVSIYISCHNEAESLIGNMDG